MLTLSIRQPFAELILRGIKTIEYRSRPTRLIGKRFFIYASKGSANWRTDRGVEVAAWSNDLEVPKLPPPWMLELANALKIFPEELPTGLVVGSAIIERCEKIHGDVDEPYYQWHLGNVERLKTYRAPKGHPQPVWWQDR